MEFTEPAVAIAASKCWLARMMTNQSPDSVKVAIKESHPSTCGWCSYPLDELMKGIEWFNRYDSDNAYEISATFGDAPVGAGSPRIGSPGA